MKYQQNVSGLSFDTMVNLSSSERARSDVNLLLSASGRQSNRLRRRLAADSGFTLIETLVAVMLLSLAIIAPMSLAAKSLSSAYYARDQITAFYLAQEAIEALRSIRDSQILTIAQSPTGAPDIFGLIPHDNSAFIVDARKGDSAAAITSCGTAPCPYLQTDKTLYGYVGSGDDPSQWSTTYFRRTVYAHPVAGNQNEIRITVEVKWKTGSIDERTFTISEDLYRWVNDGSSQS